MHLKESRRGPIKVCRDLDKQEKLRAIISTQETPKRHKTHRRCPELLTALLQPPQLVQDTPACAYTPAAMGTCCSTQSTLYLPFFTPSHHQQAKRSITQTPPPNMVQPNEHSIPHEGNCPHTTSCSFTLQSPTKKYLPRSALWLPSAWDKEVVFCTKMTSTTASLQGHCTIQTQIITSHLAE